MQVFRAFFKVLRKKLPNSMIYLIVFLAISFPLAYGSKPTLSFENTRLDVAVFDKDGTDVSRRLCDYIAKKHNIVEVEEDRDTLMDMLYYQSIDYCLIIEDGFADKLERQEYDDLFSDYRLYDSYETVLMGQFLNQYVTSLRSYIAIGESVESAMKKTEKISDTDTQVEYANFDSDEVADFSEDFSFYFQYMPYVLICVIINALCPTLMVLRARDIRFRTNCSPIKSSHMTAQTVGASVLSVLVIWLIFVGAGIILYGGMYRGRAWYAVLNSLIFAIIVVMLAVFVSNIAKKLETVNIITQIISLGMSFLCGVFVPQYMLGDRVLAVARFLPAYWYIKANNMLSGIDVYDHKLLMICFMVQAGFAVTLAALALVVNRILYQGGVKSKLNSVAS